MPKHTRFGQRLADTYTRNLVRKAMNDFRVFERLIDYGRMKLATDVDDYVIEWLRKSNFIDHDNNATDAGKNLHKIVYTSQTS